MSNELAPRVSLHEIVAMQAEEIGVWASFDTSTEEGIKSAYNARIAPDFTIESVLNAEIEIANVVVHTAKKVDDETGEEIPLKRTILISPDGTTYACVSSGLLRDLADLMAIKGPPPWLPPVKVIPVQVPTRRGFRTFRLKMS